MPDGTDPADHGGAWVVYRSRAAALARSAAHADLTGQEPNLELFERICGFEQYLSDILATLDSDGVQRVWRDGRDALARCAVELAGFLWFDRRLGAQWTLDLRGELSTLPTAADLDLVWRTRGAGERAGLFEYLEMWPVWPECLSSEPVDYASYARRISRALRELAYPPGAVLGLRSSGSFLGPIWAAALASSGHEPRYMTVRPMHRTLSAMRESRERTPRDRHESASLRGLRVVVVDDLIGTGATIRQAVAQLTALGTDPRAISVSTYRHGAPLETVRLLGIDSSRFIGLQDVYRAWPQAESETPSPDTVVAYLEQAMAADGLAATIRDLRPLPLSHPVRTLAELTGAPIPQITEHVHGIVRNRRYRLELTMPSGATLAVVAKPLGFGVMARDEVRRLRKLPHYASVLGVFGGYLLYEWIDGEPLPFRSSHDRGLTLPRDLEVFAAVAASAQRHAPGLMSLPSAAAEDRIRLAVEELRRRGIATVPDPGAVFARLTEARIPVVAAAPNNAHWHYVRRDGGELVKLHRDIANINRRSDPVEDLAAAAMELAWEPEELIEATTRFGELTDAAPSIGRLAFGVIQHAARALREHESHTRRLADAMADRGLRRSCEADVRARGIREAVELASRLLDSAC